MKITKSNFFVWFFVLNSVISEKKIYIYINHFIFYNHNVRMVTCDLHKVYTKHINFSKFTNGL